MPRTEKAVEITRTSLQSLVPDLFDAFCSVLFANHDCLEHNPGDSPGIFFDIRAREMHPANVYYGLALISETLSFSLYLLYWSNFVEHFDKLWKNNTSGPLHGDYAGRNGRNVGK